MNRLLVPFIVALVSIDQANAVDGPNLSCDQLVASQYVSSATGDVIAPASLQSSCTLGTAVGDGYVYGGVWSNFVLQGARFSEVDLFAGYTRSFQGNLQTTIAATFVTDSSRFIAFSGEVKLARSFKLTDQLTFVPSVAWWPQVSFEGLPSGSYFPLKVEVAYQPAQLPKLQLTGSVSVVYDTGAYGANPGWTPHLELEATYTPNDSLAVNVGGRTDWNKDGQPNPSVWGGLSLKF